jgi:hypothetical protein
MSRWRITFEREFRYHDGEERIRELVAQMFLGAEEIEVKEVKKVEE